MLQYDDSKYIKLKHWERNVNVAIWCTKLMLKH